MGSNKKNHTVLSVIIPIYNEEKTICTLLDKVASCGVSVSMEMILVNDGSTDNTASLCREWIRENEKKIQARVVFLEKENGGKGSAVKAGIKVSSGDVVIIQDADLEYDPRDYTKCITPILHGECKVVYGSREADNRNRLFSSPSFFLGGLLLTYWINLLFNSDLTDEPTCYKTFDGDLIRSIPLDGDRFEWEPEVTAKLLRMGFEIREVPISYNPRKVTEGKKIKWFDGLQGLWIALFWRFAGMKEIRKTTQNVSLSCAEIMQRKRRSVYWLYGIFLFAFLIRLAAALPGLSTPQKFLIRPDSRAFLSAAGEGIFKELPSFYRLYPSSLKNWKKGTPKYEIVNGSETRAPLYTLWLSLVFGISGKSFVFAALAGCLLGAFSCLIVYLSGNVFGSCKVGIIASLLLALNPMAVTFSPLFLPDTLFLCMVALQTWFFLRFIKNAFGLNLITSVIFAALGALIRPVNALWIFPCIFVLCFYRKTELRLRLNYMLVALLLFGFLLMPWILGSKYHGIGWRIDSISSEALLKNTAALQGKQTGGNPYLIAKEFRERLKQHYAENPEKFRTLGEQLDHQDKEMIGRILKHPFRYLSLHFNPKILSQDLSELMRNWGILKPPRIMVMSLMVLCLVLYMGTALGLGWYLLAALDQKSLLSFLLLLLFSGYYFLMPGAIAVPRYQLPALPFLYLAAGYGLICLHGLVREKRLPEGLTGRGGR